MSTDAQTSSLKQQLVATWLHHDNAWMDSASVTDFFPDLPKQKIYAQVSEWSAVGVLERRKRTKGTGYEYKLHDPNSFLASAVEEPAHAKAVTTATVTHEQHAPAPSMPKLTIVPEGTKGRKPSVVWKPEEKGLLAEEVHRLRLNRPHSKLIDLLNEVQHILPQNHRRHIRGLSETPWFEPLLNQIAARKVEEVKREPAITEPVQEYTPAPEPVSVSDITTGALIDEVVKRIGVMLKQVVVQVVGSPEVQRFLNPPPQPPLYQVQEPTVERRHNPYGLPIKPAAPKLESLLLVGSLKPNHVAEIKKEFDDVYDLRFYHVDQSTALLKSMGQSADKVILLTDQIKHKQMEILDAAQVKYIRVTGSVGKLKEFLTNLYANS